MEHAYLGFTLDSVLGLHATRAKSVQVLKNAGLILSAQADKLVAYSSNLSQTKQFFNPPTKFKEQQESVQINDFVVSPNEELIAVGYSNAEISVFNREGEEVNHFTGHRRAITCLAFNNESNLLASGSQDNDIVVWDVIGDCGICRFSGHQNAITDLLFIPDTPWLVSSSKDTHIRIWDLDINACIQTVTIAASELYSLCLISINKIVAAGKSPDFFSFIISDPDSVDPKNPVVLTPDVQINRDTKHRVQDIALSPDGKSLAFVTSGENIDVWKVLSDEEMEKKKKRRAKRAQKSGGQATEVLQFEKEQTITLPTRLCNAEFLGKSIVATLADNSIVVLENSLREGEESPSFKIVHQTMGHTSDIRGLAFFGQSENDESSPDRIISASEGCVKIWDLESRQCIQTISCGMASSLAVLPGGRFFIVGTREGNIEMGDASTGTMYAVNKCHDGRIWQIVVSPGCTEVATASSDKEVRFWNIGFKNDQPVLLHKRTLKLNDEVYSIAYSPDSKYIAAALLDSTVRIFNTDTLNFHISLYGSHLPVTFVDFSYDNELIVTASADKNMRIWGTEFGDCHRSLWAHESVVVCAKFIPNTHYAWTAGRDGVLKMWDCDTFRSVQTLRSHVGEIYAMDVSPSGSYVITGGRDKGIRLWRRTQEKIYLSIEEEKRLEQQIETANAEKNDRTIAALRGSIFGGAVVDTPGRMTVESIEHGDRLRDDIAAADKERESPGENPLMRTISPKDYLLNSMRKINRADMDVVMQSLPFSSAVSFIQWASEWLAEGKEIELTVRCINSLIKFHERQMEASPEVKEVFIKIRDLVHSKVNEMRSRCGSNLAALKIIQKEIQRPF